jgi:hypothetical protein
MTSIADVSCAICGHKAPWIGDHVVVEHGMTVVQYEDQYGPVHDPSLDVILDLDAPPRKHPDMNIRVNFAGALAGVHLDVPASACLSLPRAYRIPEHGQLAADVREAAVALRQGRTMYVHGLPGTGKDALFHAWSALTRTPALMFQMEPGADIRSWFYSHEFNQNRTFWKHGSMLRALRNGYTTPTGRKVPYMILITDFDRATRDQAESMRLVMDSIEGRVMGPHGVTYPVLPGTQIVVTANTAGGGDARGRMTSANVIDGSILDRFERKFEFHWMDWKDEGPVVKEKFPILLAKAPKAFDQVGRATAAIREAVQKEELYTEFSHRAVCAWVGHAQDIVEVTGTLPTDLLRRGFRVIADGMPDAETRAEIIKIVDPHIRGGTV